MRPLLIATVGCLVAALSAAAVHAAREPRVQRLFAQWKAADANGDGRLSRAESAGVPSLVAHFDAIDRNADGQIEAEEVRAWRLARKAKRPSAPRRSALDEALAAADADGDGALSRSETRVALPRMAGKFDRMDLDRDGRLSRAEIDAWIARRRAARRP